MHGCGIAIRPALVIACFDAGRIHILFQPQPEIFQIAGQRKSLARPGLAHIITYTIFPLYSLGKVLPAFKGREPEGQVEHRTASVILPNSLDQINRLTSQK
jgi:hypothetical protein